MAIHTLNEAPVYEFVPAADISVSELAEAVYMILQNICIERGAFDKLSPDAQRHFHRADEG